MTMSSTRRFITELLMLFGVAWMSLVSPAYAGTPGPVIPEANARFSADQGCVEPVEEMRKNHFKYILHQRDETVHEGIRSKQHSLTECINCHVPADREVRVQSEEHFCNTCHTYASVSIDCFQCHSDRPVKTSRIRPVTMNADQAAVTTTPPAAGDIP